MSFKVLQCPVCGAGGVEARGTGYFCRYCTTEFSDNAAEEAFKRLSESIDSRVESIIDERLRREKEERFYNLRSNLWEKVHAKYIDSDAIVAICTDIKKIEPHDFLAEFFEVANSAPAAEVSEFINKINVRANELYLDLVIDFMISSLTSEYIAPTNYLIERAFRGKDLVKFEEYITRLEEEAQKVDSGVYETMVPRDVFIAYSSKDIDKVLELMTVLEENGLSCFVAMRNLQHGRGAVANYEKALHEAIDNSKMLVFVSSKNSRNFQCDAFKKELSYIRQSELMAAPCPQNTKSPESNTVLTMKGLLPQTDL